MLRDLLPRLHRLGSREELPPVILRTGFAIPEVTIHTERVRVA